MNRWKLLVVLVAGALTLTGCDFSIYKLPLPGGADTGDNPITVRVKFVDVLDLVPMSTVKANDVTVGKVTDVSLEGYVADVTLELRNDTGLPDNALAEIRQTSLLGEKFVSLKAPDSDPSANLLDDDDVIPLARSGRNPEVEEVLGALSLVLNGGGIAQLKTIASELNLALEGREGSAKSVLTQIDTLMGTLDENKADIIDAIEALNRVSLSVRKQRKAIDSALDELPSALLSLNRQRNDLVRMLQSLNKLSDVGVRVIRASKAGTIDSLTKLNPVLTQLANSGDDFVDSINASLTYPFVDSVVGRDPQVARNLHMGDYVNLSIKMDFTVDPESGLPEVPGLPEEICIPFDELSDVTDLPALSQLCNGARKRVTKCLNDLKDGKLDGKACRGLVDGAVGDVIKLPPALPDEVDELLGLNRAPYDARDDGSSASAPRGPTMGQLMDAYDSDLVGLLVPGMVIR